MDPLKEYLEELKQQQRIASIRFKDVDGVIQTVQGHVVKLETLAGRDIVETDAAFIIGLDQIQSVNDRSFENIC